MRVDGYAISKLVYSSASSRIYEAICEADGVAVVLKRYLEGDAGERDSRALDEFNTLRRIASVNVPRAIELAASDKGPTLVLERMPGVPLAGVIAGTPLTIGAWLDLAIQLAQAMASVHQARILHKNVNPANVLLEAQAGRVSIIGFGLAIDLGAAEQSGRLEHDSRISLRYVAPEQTGRMNRGCDARSDLYSLGATLYHAMTGRPPFESLDLLELIHCHIARLPEPPSELRPEAPEALSALILKLLRKQPEERYQSARGLLFDLCACRDQWTQSSSIDVAFQLGTAESPSRPCFSTLLYGRDHEIGVLRDALGRTQLGQLECVLIRGESGAGKTTLMEHLRTQLTQSTGYLAFGAFDRERERPYAGWVSLLESFAHQLLVESDEDLARWRSEFGAGIGSIAGALVEHVPDLRLIFGEFAPVPVLGPRETQARLSLALQRMLQVCATAEHPLVLLLDDLQWSDAGSRSLLEDLMSSEISAALLIIVTHRDRDPETDQPLAPFLRHLEQQISRLEVLNLGPLPTDAVVAMLAETLLRTPTAVLPLAQWIEGATGNSPLMIRQFIEHLHDRSLLRYQPDVGWTWEAAEIASIAMPDSAIAMLVAKMERVDPQTRSVLKFASCMGDEFGRDRLSELSRISPGDLERALYALCDAGLLVPSGEGFRFLHHRIREAAQSQLSALESSRLHYEAGRLLLLHVPEAERAERVFEIVEQLDRGLDHLPEDLRWQVIELNMAAGRRALSAGAAATADRYLSVARQLLRQGDRVERRPIIFGLHLDSAESAFQIGSYDNALALLHEMESEPLEPLQRAQVAVKRVRVFTLTQHPEDCTRYALAVLRQLGVRWPLHPSSLRVWAELAATEWKLRGRNGIQLRPCTKISAKWIARLIVLEPSGGAMSRSDARLPLLSTCLALRCFVRHGYTAAPGLTLASYALASYHWLNSPRRSLQLGRLALDWMQRVPDASRGMRAEMQIHALLHPWLMPRRQALAPLERIAQLAEELGDREYAYYARLNSYSPLALAGDPVATSERRLRTVAESARRASLLCPDEGERMHAVYRLLLVDLSAAALQGHVTESDTWIASNPSSADPYIRTLWLLVLCVYGRHDLALAQSEALGNRLFRIVPFVHVADHTFLRGLAAAALAADAPARTRRALVRTVHQSLRRLRRWARGGPDFVHMVMLLEAERARLRRKLECARALYPQAAQHARKQGYPHHAALIHERHADLLLALRRHTECDAALGEAATLYREWGALPKAEALAAQQGHGHPRDAHTTPL